MRRRLCSRLGGEYYHTHPICYPLALASAREQGGGTGAGGAQRPYLSRSGGVRQCRAARPTRARQGEPRGLKGGQSRRPSPSKRRPADDECPESPNEGPDAEADVPRPPAPGGGGAKGKKKLDPVFDIHDAGSDDEGMAKQADKGDKLSTFAPKELVGADAKALGSVPAGKRSAGDLVIHVAWPSLVWMGGCGTVL